MPHPNFTERLFHTDIGKLELVNTAIVTLSQQGARLMANIADKMDIEKCYLHEKAEGEYIAERFSRMADLTSDIFNKYEGIIFIAPIGAVVRVIAPHVKDKTTDPAIVQLDIGGRWAVSLLSGHEGEANTLCMDVANSIGAEPVITSSNEAGKNIIVGVGCKKGKSAELIKNAVMDALDRAEVSLENVRIIASADVKLYEEGILEAASQLGVPVRFIHSDEIRNSSLTFERSEFVEKSVNLPAVAEPAALLAGRRSTLILKKTAYDGITVAVARENFL